MTIYIILLLISIVCFSVLWNRISLKIPRLAAISDDVITARFEEDSARFRLLLSNLRLLYREGKLKRFFWRLLAKLIRRTHIVLLRLDNGAVSLLEHIKSRAEDAGGAVGEAGKPEVIISGRIPRRSAAGMNASPERAK